LRPQQRLQFVNAFDEWLQQLVELLGREASLLLPNIHCVVRGSQ
jgi:hypothetical protein